MDTSTTATTFPKTRTTPPAPTGFLRLPDVLKRYPVSKSTWWAGIKAGKYPKQVKLSERTSAWRESDIDELCNR